MRSRRAGAVVLLSGGLDSAVALAITAEQGGGEILALTADYGQRARHREAAAARGLARRFGATHRVVALPFLRAIAPAAFTRRGRRLPHPTRRQLGIPGGRVPRAARDAARAVWIPNRNGVLCNVAAAFAEARGLPRVIAGFNREEAATFPDNSQAFVRAANRALAWSTLTGVRVESPTARWTKARIVREALVRGIPLDKLWPCYDGRAGLCGRCESCLRFRRACDAAGARL